MTPPPSWVAVAVKELVILSYQNRGHVPRVYFRFLEYGKLKGLVEVTDREIQPNDGVT